MIVPAPLDAFQLNDTEQVVGPLQVLVAGWANGAVGGVAGVALASFDLVL